jgi:hypothetical protein
MRTQAVARSLARERPEAAAPLRRFGVGLPRTEPRPPRLRRAAGTPAPCLRLGFGPAAAARPRCLAAWPRRPDGGQGLGCGRRGLRAGPGQARYPADARRRGRESRSTRSVVAARCQCDGLPVPVLSASVQAAVDTAARDPGRDRDCRIRLSPSAREQARATGSGRALHRDTTAKGGAGDRDRDAGP